MKYLRPIYKAATLRRTIVKVERRRAHSALGSMPGEWTSCHESGATKLNLFVVAKVEKVFERAFEISIYGKRIRIGRMNCKSFKLKRRVSVDKTQSRSVGGGQGNNDENDVFSAVVERAGAEAHEGKEWGDFELARAVRLGDAKILPFKKGWEAVAWGKLVKVFEDEPLGGDVVADEVSLVGRKEEDLVKGDIRNGEEGAFRR
ncbi:hypothetical protein ACLOJK_041134 [Asimina triloba]